VRFEEAEAAPDGEGERGRWRQKRGEMFHEGRAEGETAPRIGRGLAGERGERRPWLCAVGLKRRGHNCDPPPRTILSRQSLQISCDGNLLQHGDMLPCR
jgi:hypothetical protein